MGCTATTLIFCSLNWRTARSFSSLTAQVTHYEDILFLIETKRGDHGFVGIVYQYLKCLNSSFFYLRTQIWLQITPLKALIVMAANENVHILNALCWWNILNSKFIWHWRRAYAISVCVEGSAKGSSWTRKLVGATDVCSLWVFMMTWRIFNSACCRAKDLRQCRLQHVSEWLSFQEKLHLNPPVHSDCVEAFIGKSIYFLEEQDFVDS